MTKKLKKKKVVSKRIVKKIIKKRPVKKTAVRKSKTIKRTAFKPKVVLKAAKVPAKKLLGKVVHFYPHISVAVVEVAASIKQGDKISLQHHDVSFHQNVSSMQIDYTNISEAKKGQVIGMKVAKPVKEGTMVYAV